MTEFAYNLGPETDVHAAPVNLDRGTGRTQISLRHLIERNRAELEAQEQERRERIQTAAREGLKAVEVHIGRDAVRTTAKILGIELED